MWRRPARVRWWRDYEYLVWPATDPGIEIDPYASGRASRWRRPTPQEPTDGGRLLDDFVAVARPLRPRDLQQAVENLVTNWGLWNFCDCGEHHVRPGVSAPPPAIVLKGRSPRPWPLRRRARCQWVSELVSAAAMVNAFRTIEAAALEGVVFSNSDSGLSDAWSRLAPSVRPTNDQDLALRQLELVMNEWLAASHVGPRVQLRDGTAGACMVTKGLADAVVWAVFEEFTLGLEIAVCRTCAATWRVRAGKRPLKCERCRDNVRAKKAQRRKREHRHEGRANRETTVARRRQS